MTATMTIQKAIEYLDDGGEVLRGVQNHPMNPEFKARWLEALRSGDYCQDSTRLRTTSGYCCLGVACDLIDSTKWNETPPNESVVDSSWVWEDSMIHLPETTTYITGLTPGTQTFLAALNDRDVPFADIADWIEENL